jgi:hypothetical protein
VHYPETPLVVEYQNRIDQGISIGNVGRVVSTDAVTIVPSTTIIGGGCLVGGSTLVGGQTIVGGTTLIAGSRAVVTGGPYVMGGAQYVTGGTQYVTGGIQYMIGCQQIVTILPSVQYVNVQPQTVTETVTYETNPAYATYATSGHEHAEDAHYGRQVYTTTVTEFVQGATVGTR